MKTKKPATKKKSAASKPAASQALATAAPADQQMPRAKVEIFNPGPPTPFDEPVAPPNTPKAKARRTAATKAPKPAKEAKPAKVAKEPGTTKRDTILTLISRATGATLEEIMMATGWQKHSVPRGAISTMGKTTKIESSKSPAGGRTYKAA
jgi:hypothetical protein